MKFQRQAFSGNPRKSDVTAQLDQTFQQQRRIGFVGKRVIATHYRAFWDRQRFSMARDLHREVRALQCEALFTRRDAENLFGGYDALCHPVTAASSSPP